MIGWVSSAEALIGPDDLVNYWRGPSEPEQSIRSHLYALTGISSDISFELHKWEDSSLIELEPTSQVFQRIS